MRRPSRALPFLLPALLAACSSPAPVPEVGATARLSLFVPDPPGARAQYVSSATQSVTVAVDGSNRLTLNAAQCPPVTGGRQCVATLVVPSGSRLFDVKAWSAPNGTGSVLSDYSGTQTLTANTDNALSLRLTTAEFVTRLNVPDVNGVQLNTAYGVTVRRSGSYAWRLDPRSANGDPLAPEDIKNFAGASGLVACVDSPKLSASVGSDASGLVLNVTTTNFDEAGRTLTVKRGVACATGVTIGTTTLNAEGTPLWAVDLTPYTGGVNVFSSSPALGSDGTVYLALPGGTYAFDPAPTAPDRLKWAWTVADAGVRLGSFTYVNLGSDGTVYSQLDSTVSALDPAADAAGRRKWTFDVRTLLGGAYTRGTGALGADGTLYLPTNVYVIALDTRPNVSNRLVWSVDFAGTEVQGSSPVVDRNGSVVMSGAFYAPTFASGAFALDPAPSAANRLRWGVNLGVGGASVGTAASPAVGGDGTVYVGNRAGVAAIDPSPGAPNRVKWTFALPSIGVTGGTQVWSGPVIGPDGTLYVGTRDGRIFALDASPNATDRVRWSHAINPADVNGLVYSVAAVGRDGTVYVGGGVNAGVLYALDPDPNAATRVKWTHQVDAITSIRTSPTVTPDGVVYIASRTKLSAVAALSAGLAESPWPKHMRDLRNSGR